LRRINQRDLDNYRTVSDTMLASAFYREAGTVKPEKLGSAKTSRWMSSFD